MRENYHSLFRRISPRPPGRQKKAAMLPLWKLALYIVTLCMGLPALSQVTIGTGTSTQVYPLGNYYGYERSASLYTAAEVGTQGIVNKIAWNSTSAGTFNRPIKIYLKETTASTLSAATWANTISGATLVYDGSVNPAVGWNEFSLTSTFIYSGGSNNLLILVEANYGGGGSGTSAGTAVQYSTATTRHMFVRADNTAPTGNTSTTNLRPNVQLTLIAATPCTTPDNPTALSISNVTSTSIAGTITPAGTAPAGYIVIRSLSSSLGASPAASSSYSTGSTIGNGTVVATPASTSFTDTSLSPNTQYYYFVYAANTGTCAPSYSSSAVSAVKATCAADPLAVGVSNLTSSTATVNWTSAIGGGSNAVTYNVEISANNFATIANSATGVNALKYAFSGLTANTAYSYRIKAVSDGCTSGNWITGTFTAEDMYTPIDVTGFNLDVIANGTGNPGLSSTGSVDAGTNVYVTIDYRPNATSATGVGFPLNRVISNSTPGHRFFMQDYAANNSLKLPTVNVSGTFTLTKSLQLNNLYLAVVAGEAAATFTAEILFSDGTTQLATGLTAPNWDSSPSGVTPVMTGMGRADRNVPTSVTSSPTNTFKVFPVTINIEAANQSKYVTGVRLTKTTPANATLNIFAVSGKTTPSCNYPSTLTTSGLTDSQVTFNWGALNPAPAAGYEYYYSTTNTAPLGSAAINNTNVVSTNTATVTLPGMGTYYWWVRSVCSASETSSWSSGGSFITSCATPAVATDAIIANTTASSLTLTWTAPATAPTGYLVIRSTTPTLSATPVTGTTYTANASFGGGIVAYVGTATTYSAASLNSNTKYYYTVYSYNGGAICNGPSYSTTTATTSVVTCVTDPLIVGASNVTNSQANLNWSSSTGGGSNPVTYNVEVSTDNFATTTASASGISSLQYSLTGLTANATYAFRVKAISAGCTTGNWVTANGSFIATNTFTPLDVTGYNYDVIADGLGTSLSSTTSAVDDATSTGNGGYAYMANSFKINATDAAITYALPLNRVLVSPIANLSGLKFFLGDYAANNSLKIGAANESGTLTLSTPVKLTDIYLAVTGGSGGPTIKAEITFDDGTIQDPATSVTFPDWYTGSGTILAGNIGRAARGNNGIEYSTNPSNGGAKVFQVAIPILASNQGKKVVSVKLTKTSTAAGFANMFAISGKIIGDCPTMGSVTATSAAYNQGTISWTLGNPGGTPVSSVTYKVEVFTNADFTGAVTGSPFSNISASTYTVSGLTALTTYYYKVTAGNGYCDSASLTGSFTTTPTCIVPGNLVANGNLGGATLSWSAPTALPDGGYQYYYSTTNTAPTATTTVSGAVAAGVTTATLTGLTTDITYYVWVRSNCSDTDKSAWSASASFFTGYCTPTYSSCDATHNISQVAVTGGNTSFSNAIAGTDACSAAGRNRISTLITVSPGVTYNFSATTLGCIGLGIAADLNANGSFTDATDLINLPLYMDGTGCTYTYNVGITIPADQALGQYRIRLWNRTANSGNGSPVDSPCGAYSYGSYVDYTLNVVPVPTCYSPTAPVSSAVLATTATIGWTAPATIPAAGYEYYYSTSSTAPTAATTVSGSVATGTSANLTALAPSTNYYFWIRSSCSESDKSTWTSSGTFTTTQVTASLPFSDGFEGANGWSFVNGTQSNKWFTGSLTSNGGTKSLYISNDAAGATYNYDTQSSSVTQVYRDIAIPAGTTTGEFSFDWKNVGEGGYDYLRVWLAPTSYIPASGTQTGTGSGRIQVGGDFAGSAVYTTYTNTTLNLSSFAGQTMRLVFEWRNDFTDGDQPPGSIDNVILAIPTCPAPTGVTATSGGFATGTISWTGNTSSYDYYYSTTNTAPATTVAGTTVTTTTANLSNLTSNATYYVWVRSHCSDTDKSSWVSGGSFYTGYCTPTYAQACDTGHRISAISVTQTGFNTTMTTGCTHDYTATQIAVTAGSTYTFNMISTGWIGVGIAADINGNGNLNDTGDIIALTNWINADVATYTANITIPANTAPGLYRIRFWQREGNGGPGNSPCGSYDWGTWVDYTLNVTTPCFNWVGVNSVWTNTANWCGGALPTATSDVVIPATANNPVISAGTAFAHNLTVGAGAMLTVATGATLSVDNILSVNPAGTLTVANNGALLQGAATATNDNAGKITIHKNANPLYRMDYTMWSSPVAAQNLLAFSPATASGRFFEYKYGQSNGTWIEGYWPVTPGDHSFEAAKGYLIRMPNENGLSGYNAGTATLPFDGVFTGIPNNGNVNIALSTAAGRYTAVGNPYPSPISVADFFTANSGKLHGTTGLYLWRKRNNSASASYATLTQAGYIANPDDSTTSATNLGSFYQGANATVGNWLISQGQGFIVKTASGLTAPQLNFTNSMRRAAPGATQGFFRTAQSTASKLWMNLKAQNGTASQVLIAYMEEGTLGLDYGYDGLKLGDGNTVSFYSVAENTSLAIQARPEFNPADVVPMGFTVPTAGQFTIGLDHTEGVFNQDQVIYLKDNTEGIIRNITDHDYTFTSEAGTFEGRFEVVYRTSALGTDNPTVDPDTVVVYKQGNTININTGSTLINGVTIFDIRGRELYSATGINDTKAAVNNLNIAQQVIIVEVNTVKGKVSKRIVY